MKVKFYMKRKCLTKSLLVCIFSFACFIILVLDDVSFGAAFTAMITCTLGNKPEVLVNPDDSYKTLELLGLRTEKAESFNVNYITNITFINQSI